MSMANMESSNPKAREPHDQAELVRVSSPKDPWVHRSTGMSCSTCMWYVQKAKSEGSLNTAPIGRCRRHAPTMNGYPVVFETDWCGDHKLDENCS